MKNLLILSITFFGLLAKAELTEIIREDLNNWLGETVNEGETTAEVISVRCSQPRSSENKKVVFCSAKVTTTYDSGDSKPENGTAVCHSLGYVIDSKHAKPARYHQDSFHACMEAIYDASYE